MANSLFTLSKTQVIDKDFLIEFPAKLQNTPQLIYMCREALKIEA